MRQEKPPDSPSKASSPKPSLRALAVSRIIAFSALFQRPMTLGVRGLVIDPENRVLLVRHTYIPGFYLPGGGVEGGETLLQAVTRELQEEGGVHLLSAPVLHSVYLNRRISHRDHVALFVVRNFACPVAKAPDHEIAEAGFFELDKLPEGVSPATRARLAEVLDGEPVSPYW